MIDLKPYMDDVLATEAEVQRIANEIDEQFRLGTDEGRAQALEMKAQLDEAQRKHDEAVSLYKSMQNANRPNDVAKNFVPVSISTSEPEDNQPTVIKRQDYNQLSLMDRAQFVKSGGTVSD